MWSSAQWVNWLQKRRHFRKDHERGKDLGVLRCIRTQQMSHTKYNTANNEKKNQVLCVFLPCLIHTPTCIWPIDCYTLNLYQPFFFFFFFFWGGGGGPTFISKWADKQQFKTHNKGHYCNYHYAPSIQLIYGHTYVLFNQSTITRFTNN